MNKNETSCRNACAVTIIAGKTGSSADDEAPVIIRRLWAGFVIAAAVAVVSVIVRANRMTMEEAREAFGSFANYLKFTDDWGTQRGYVAESLTGGAILTRRAEWPRLFRS